MLCNCSTIMKMRLKVMMRLISDIGSLHFNDVQRCDEHIDWCRRLSMDLKFQLFTKAGKNLVLQKDIFDYACAQGKNKNVNVYASIFDCKFIDWVKDCTTIKLAYSQRKNIELIDACIKTGKELIITANLFDDIPLKALRLYTLADSQVAKYPWDITPDLRGFERLFNGISFHGLNLDMINNNFDVIEMHCRLGDDLELQYPDGKIAQKYEDVLKWQKYQ